MDLITVLYPLAFGAIQKHIFRGKMPTIPNNAIPYINGIGATAWAMFFGDTAGDFAGSMEAGAVMAASATGIHQLIKMPLRHFIGKSI